MSLKGKIEDQKRAVADEAEATRLQIENEKKTAEEAEFSRLLGDQNQLKEMREATRLASETTKEAKVDLNVKSKTLRDLRNESLAIGKEPLPGLPEMRIDPDINKEEEVVEYVRARQSFKTASEARRGLKETIVGLYNIDIQTLPAQEAEKALEEKQQEINLEVRKFLIEHPNLDSSEAGDARNEIITEEQEAVPVRENAKLFTENPDRAISFVADKLVKRVRDRSGVTSIKRDMLMWRGQDDPDWTKQREGLSNAHIDTFDRGALQQALREVFPNEQEKAHKIAQEVLDKAEHILAWENIANQLYVIDRELNELTEPLQKMRQLEQKRAALNTEKDALIGLKSRLLSEVDEIASALDGYGADQIVIKNYETYRKGEFTTSISFPAEENQLTIAREAFARQLEELNNSIGAKYNERREIEDSKIGLFRKERKKREKESRLSAIDKEISILKDKRKSLWGDNSDWATNHMDAEGIYKSPNWQKKRDDIYAIFKDFKAILDPAREYLISRGEELDGTSKEISQELQDRASLRVSLIEEELQEIEEEYNAINTSSPRERLQKITQELGSSQDHQYVDTGLPKTFYKLYQKFPQEWRQEEGRRTAEYQVEEQYKMYGSTFDSIQQQVRSLSRN